MGPTRPRTPGPGPPVVQVCLLIDLQRNVLGAVHAALQLFKRVILLLHDLRQRRAGPAPHAIESLHLPREGQPDVTRDAAAHVPAALGSSGARPPQTEPAPALPHLRLQHQQPAVAQLSGRVRLAPAAAQGATASTGGGAAQQHAACRRRRLTPQACQQAGSVQMSKSHSLLCVRTKCSRRATHAALLMRP